MAIIPILPLPLVMFPGSKIPLRILEVRDMDMIRDCFLTNTGFGIVMFEAGDQLTGQNMALPDSSQIGTYVDIIDFEQLDNGLLGILVEGQVKFVARQLRQQENGLTTADADFIALESEQSVPENMVHLSSLLRTLAGHELVQRLDLDIDYENARDVSHRLAELIPVGNDIKQKLLELKDPLTRLEQLAVIVRRLQG